MIKKYSKALPQWDLPPHLKQFDRRSSALSNRRSTPRLIPVALIMALVASAILLVTIIVKRDGVEKNNSLQLTHNESTVTVEKPATPVITSPAIAIVPSSEPSANEQALVPFKQGPSLKPTSSNNSHQQQWVSNWLSKRYRVDNDVTHTFVTTAYKTAKETKLDPLLILAVMAIESSLNPFAESPVGAQGLMQVMAKIHEDKFENLGGIQAALNPAANIKVGSMILKDYVTQGGSIEAGLKRYVGAGAFADDSGYGYKVLAEYRRLQDVANGKRIPTKGAGIPIALPKSAPIAADTSIPYELMERSSTTEHSPLT